MALFLLIDTVLEIGIVAIANSEGIIDVNYNNEQQQHATWLHVAIMNILKNNNLDIKNIDVISVTNGPGSYTGIRVGLSAAKGLSFALQKPLITISNLHLIAFANKNDIADIYIPMIDARRDEVFTCTYDKYFTIINDSQSLVLNSQCFNIELSRNNALFCGNGAKKLESLLNHQNAFFQNTNYTVFEFYTLTINAFSNKKDIDIALAAPNYSKDFYMEKSKK
jgi:tRNA threonylcarbamoyladenosine biosynthesis protein TsaB